MDKNRNWQEANQLAILQLWNDHYKLTAKYDKKEFD